MAKLKKGIKITFLAAITVSLGVFLFSPADAQRGPGERGGPRDFDPEQMERVWILQADSVAASLELNEETTDKLADAYVAARQSLQEKMMEMRQSEGGWEKAREARDAGIAEFKTTLEGLLTAEQSEKAMERLGGFSFRADMGVNRLSEIVEDKEPLKRAVAIIMEYMGGPRERSGPPSDSDRDERRARMDALFEKLGTVLTAEQVEAFKETLSGFGRRGPGGPGGGPRDR
ncbi:MAG: hypothetical protein KC931_15305 [Candidatus Omnitrophica bacterium]|nr:hypothetical protein [Candidatus Omnitrophota bacterium]